MSKYVQMLCFFIIPSRTCRKRHIKTLDSTTSICCRFFSVHAQQLLSDCQFSVPWILVSSSSSNEDKITLKSTGSWGFRIKMGDLRKFIADSGVVEHSPITSHYPSHCFNFNLHLTFGYLVVHISLPHHPQAVPLQQKAPELFQWYFRHKLRCPWRSCSPPQRLKLISRNK